ncbi:DMT family transporter [Hydrogenophaga luteola]|uniref:DMT family transporter n=1 Tax=Hydrogenophaga luteola TaxID=1591122 RepID=A0ABV7WAX7_9BURK
MAASLPTGMAAGIAAGLGAGAFWGTTFVAPLLLPDVRHTDLTVGRYLASALFALGFLVFTALRGRLRLPTARQAIDALWLSALGYNGYYLLLVWAIEAAGAALPALIIGTIPLWLMLLGKPQHLRWSTLLPGLLLTAGGLALMVMQSNDGASAGGPGLWVGIGWAVLAMVSWTAFGLLNARWMRQHPDVDSTLWANWLGVAAGLGSLGLWLVAGSPVGALVQRPDFGLFLMVCAITGIGAAWVASVLWNVASRRLSTSLAGQLIVSETVFALIYAFSWSGEWPAPLELLACALFIAGIMASIRAHR